MRNAMRRWLGVMTLVSGVATVAGCAAFSDPTTQGQVPVYGNWCGPGHPREGTNPPPINQTDGACMTHDVCYQNHGYFNTVCDNQLISTLTAIQTMDPAEEVARQSIIVYFENSPKL